MTKIVVTITVLTAVYLSVTSDFSDSEMSRHLEELKQVISGVDDGTLLLSQGRECAPRVWQLANGGRFKAGIIGADDVTRTMRVEGGLKDYSWDELNTSDVEYLKAYCRDTRNRMKSDQIQAWYVTSKQHFDTSISTARSQMQNVSDQIGNWISDASANVHPDDIDAYKRHKAYRGQTTPSQDSEGQAVWIDGYQTKSGKWQSGFWSQEKPTTGN